MDCIYLDNSATTPLLPAVAAAMAALDADAYGNPASAHRAGRRARQALEDARERVAACLGADADEIIFTSGATEANNLALFGLAGEAPGPIVASPVEHPSIVEPLHRLAEGGHAVEFLNVDEAGRLAPETVARPDTRLVTVQYANGETGTTQPIHKLTSTIPFHCDAVQAVGKLPVNFRDLGVTSLSLSAHKFHGPKGVGALLLRRGARLRPLTWGGHQQQGRRPGTEPVALAVGLATALDLACAEMLPRRERVGHLRQRFLQGLERASLGVVVNGAADEALPHVLNLSFLGCAADALLINLDLAGVACSTGSACSSGSLLPSPVLQAMGLSEERTLSAMRFSFSHLLSDEAIDEAIRRIVAVVRRLSL